MKKGMWASGVELEFDRHGRPSINGCIAALRGCELPPAHRRDGFLVQKLVPTGLLNFHAVDPTVAEDAHSQKHGTLPTLTCCGGRIARRRIVQITGSPKRRRDHFSGWRRRW